MDKRQLESPAHRQYIIRAVRAHIQKLMDIGLLLEEQEIEVTQGMLDVIGQQQAFQKELIVKLASE